MLIRVLREIWVHTVAIILVLLCVPIIILTMLIQPFKKK